VLNACQVLQGGRDRGRGRGRGRRGRRGHDDEEDSGMTLDEYEAMQRRPKPTMPAAAHPLGTSPSGSETSACGCLPHSYAIVSAFVAFLNQSSNLHSVTTSPVVLITHSVVVLKEGGLTSSGVLICLFQAIACIHYCLSAASPHLHIYS